MVSPTKNVHYTDRPGAEIYENRPRSHLFRGTAGGFGFILLQVSKDRYNFLERKVILNRCIKVIDRGHRSACRSRVVAG